MAVTLTTHPHTERMADHGDFCSPVSGHDRLDSREYVRRRTKRSIQDICATMKEETLAVREHWRSPHGP